MEYTDTDGQKWLLLKAIALILDQKICSGDVAAVKELVCIPQVETWPLEHQHSGEVHVAGGGDVLDRAGCCDADEENARSLGSQRSHPPTPGFRGTGFARKNFGPNDPCVGPG